ncbi:MAG: hypothetical protein A2622_01535 [Bdellovibrionales bacterium RIFCSPHIGHO2_01_FULL_40_29]|nr:MAG: hypothetical protein A2622_01535 [Bdellovibrionales bacterium RIFCSPHIGHO2_01_FULL_40_29]OFZ33779.1 MAG: hypothetical protein A3D17_01955 [Bdellovibrionales bacterium RIFCSPHIGHO2_02_FULL_40_15]
MITLGRRLVAIAIITSACWAQATTQDQKAAAAITLRNNQFRTAVMAHDAAAASNIYHADVVFMAPDIPTLQGKVAVQAYLEQQIMAGAVDIQLTTQSIRALKSKSPRNIQYEEIGTNVITFNFGGTLVQIPGKYMVIWDFHHGLNHPPKVFRDAFSFSVPTK